MIDVIIPTFRRPHALKRAVDNVRENTTLPMTLTFVVEPDDQESKDEITRIGEKFIVSKYPGNHTGASNTAYEMTSEPFLIVANDDFNFHRDWAERALEKMTPGIGVVGLNDGSGSGEYTAITLVMREYIDKYSGCMDVPGVLYFPKYNHNYVDTEFSLTAMKRGMWAVAERSIVEHLHWSFNKAPMDKTYEKSLGTAGQDEQTYLSRMHLFT